MKGSKKRERAATITNKILLIIRTIHREGRIEGKGERSTNTAIIILEVVT